MDFMHAVLVVLFLCSKYRWFSIPFAVNPIRMSCSNEGGNNILKSLELAKNIGAKVCGVVGRDGGYTKQVADVCIVVPTVNEKNVTPHTEAFQAVVWHLLVAHPLLLANEMKWESTK